ncbi:hypothetical protein IMZ31_22000 (plasmid) [Pontibacillus sp. ALD_SL1]|uniref:hypothetical protein n=1 Tax=Pontibacillus sp. ALD_SL1 TaxID=2777185 RepID=UPI001A96268B|nr:hypothetical protein [Pontibacillus sp. ALD_SL1]QST02127.1 hypothetical protein IMZ31_22000 [Pontibacillus sp. ALD_SL1]
MTHTKKESVHEWISEASESLRKQIWKEDALQGLSITSVLAIYAFSTRIFGLSWILLFYSVPFVLCYVSLCRYSIHRKTKTYILKEYRKLLQEFE